MASLTPHFTDLEILPLLMPNRATIPPHNSPRPHHTQSQITRANPSSDASLQLRTLTAILSELIYDRHHREILANAGVLYPQFERRYVVMHHHYEPRVGAEFAYCARLEAVNWVVVREDRGTVKLAEEWGGSAEEAMARLCWRVEGWLCECGDGGGEGCDGEL